MASASRAVMQSRHVKLHSGGLPGPAPSSQLLQPGHLLGQGCPALHVKPPPTHTHTSSPPPSHVRARHSEAPASPPSPGGPVSFPWRWQQAWSSCPSGTLLFHRGVPLQPAGATTQALATHNTKQLAACRGTDRQVAVNGT